MAQIVSMLKPYSRVPVLVEPNAGKPRLLAGVTVYTMEPHDFAHGIMRCLQAGARILGGCCGTTPAHIAALRELRKGRDVAP
jgi:5-methyltetrahydrofolate--homocysteine methyltransferase